MNHTEFCTALLDPSATVPGDIRVREGADRTSRFGVYRNNVIVALIDGLADSFPVVRALVGEDFFRGMAHEFARHHPPCSPVMAEYGDGFPAFIESFPPAQSLPYLGDVARLEWQYVVSYHAADAEALTAEKVGGLLADPEFLATSRWRLHPSLGLLASPYPVVSLWQAHQEDSDTEVEAALAGIDLAQSEAALVLRQQLAVMVLGLTAAEATFVRALHAGEMLAVAVADAQQTANDFDPGLAFSLLLRSDALIGYSITT
ncbi:DNA-binding domain-containing protein [Pseudomonas aeruginosa]|jgi:hypothetical protein|uniref:HvfC/BufC N-terminal domain-containing protein n=1 Tax=Pseudomonadaceae TaxID=135621 RepID=UPI001C3EDABF|nr:DNA-binding domain-containing protein [Pseudomonas aeruginosa]MCS7561379.1 DNA-binding domain-containing protein [Pseudomonas aeruginosa]MCS7586150.1 DNA-binding domain-containing protein [Pseudomonas aeruginosa]MCS7598955.1 DNA-binding domain-containing protein [Pseudomonas aeruginosa]MCS7605602.1 DNA-binding domain-containing protein [Pseudomonas aeruginosa]